MVLFWGLVIFGIVALVRYLGGTRDATGSTPAAGRQTPPEEMLAERFARGEIDDDEYQRRRELLRGR